MVTHRPTDEMTLTEMHNEIAEIEQREGFLGARMLPKSATLFPKNMFERKPTDFDARSLTALRLEVDRDMVETIKRIDTLPLAPCDPPGYE